MNDKYNAKAEIIGENVWVHTGGGYIHILSPQNVQELFNERNELKRKLDESERYGTPEAIKENNQANAIVIQALINFVQDRQTKYQEHNDKTFEELTKYFKQQGKM